MIKSFNFKQLNIEIEIKNLDFVKNNPRIFNYAHRTNFFQLIYIQTGSALFKIDFQDVQLSKGDVIILLPNQVCEFDTFSEYSGKNILFTAKFYSISDKDSEFLHSAEIFSLINIQRQVNIKTEFVDNIVNIIENELNKPYDSFQSTICQSLLKSLLYGCERLINKNKTNYPASIVKNFISLVEEYYKENKNVDFYVNELCIGEKKLTNEVKKVCGASPKQYINNRLLLEARRLLRYSELSIKEIAWELGFDDLANFSNWFKKYCASSPLQFRKNE